nr:unnamed protein product [Digitaria exilis]
MTHDDAPLAQYAEHFTGHQHPQRPLCISLQANRSHEEIQGRSVQNHEGTDLRPYACTALQYSMVPLAPASRPHDCEERDDATWPSTSTPPFRNEAQALLKAEAIDVADVLALLLFLGCCLSWRFPSKKVTRVDRRQRGGVFLRDAPRVRDGWRPQRTDISAAGSSPRPPSPFSASVVGRGSFRPQVQVPTHLLSRVEPFVGLSQCVRGMAVVVGGDWASGVASANKAVTPYGIVIGVSSLLSCLAIAADCSRVRRRRSGVICRPDWNANLLKAENYGETLIAREC